MKKILLLILITLNFAPLKAQEIITEKSKIHFEISNMGFRTVEGTFGGFEGDMNFNPLDLKNASFNVFIKVNTVDTDNKKRDEHLLKDDFFDAINYPKISFQSTSITKTKSGYSATGKLSMHGITKEVTIPFTYNNNTFTGKLILNRLDYEVGADTGTFMVGNEVIINITCAIN